MNPVEFCVALDIETLVFEHFNTSCPGLQIWIQLVVDVLAGVNVGDW